MIIIDWKAEKDIKGAEYSPKFNPGVNTLIGMWYSVKSPFILDNGIELWYKFKIVSSWRKYVYLSDDGLTLDMFPFLHPDSLGTRRKYEAFEEILDKYGIILAFAHPPKLILPSTFEDFDKKANDLLSAMYITHKTFSEKQKGTQK